jgi:predicted N-acyltransferase
VQVPLQIAVHDRASALSESDWLGLDTDGDPFMSRAFLAAAEESGAAGERLGWQPMHLSVRGDDHRLRGVLPLYLRHHSFGDFSHDWNWESAWRQAGLDYYPKLVTGVPFTPSPGPRLLSDVRESDSIGPVLIAAAKQLTAELGASSWQCILVHESERELLDAAGLLSRRGVQFHWINRDYRDFGDFLATFSTDKRKKLKRERRAVRDAGLRIEVRHGDEIGPELWTAVHRHYRDTFARHGNHPAFSREFFVRLGAALQRRMVVFVAWQGDQAVASAVCFRNQTRLYGRHWGTDVDCPGLHFELCYYSGIEYAIAEGLKRFEPGAQGEHKLARGFEPVPTWSGYWIAEARMRPVVANFLAREARAVEDYQADMVRHLPFK